jgi:hypothetical protein
MISKIYLVGLFPALAKASADRVALFSDAVFVVMFFHTILPPFFDSLDNESVFS